MDNANPADTLICIGMAVASDLPNKIGERNRYVKDMNGRPIRCGTEQFEYRPSSSELRVYSFPQTWGSTALGFGGIGGAAMTTATTTVILYESCGLVYFGQRKAYLIERINETFWNDVCKFNMAYCDESSKYER